MKKTIREWNIDFLEVNGDDVGYKMILDKIVFKIKGEREHE